MGNQNAVVLTLPNDNKTMVTFSTVELKKGKLPKKKYKFHLILLNSEFIILTALEKSCFLFFYVNI